jgi:hypothetical protein
MMARDSNDLTTLNGLIYRIYQTKDAFPKKGLNKSRDYKQKLALT